MRYLLSWYSFVCWLSYWGCVNFWVESDSFEIELVGMRCLLCRSKFVRWLSMRGCVPFWEDADSLLNWVCGGALAFEMKQIRLLIMCVGMRSLLSWYSFVYLLSMWGWVSFWVEANTFTVWDWGIALPSELIQFRFLIEYVGMRSLLSRSRFVCWLSVWVYVSFWVEANTLLFEIEEVRYLLSWNRFVPWLSMWGCVPL